MSGAFELYEKHRREQLEAQKAKDEARRKAEIKDLDGLDAVEFTKKRRQMQRDREAALGRHV